MKVLVTGATGKVGQHLLPALTTAMIPAGGRIVALCHNRTIPETDHLTVVRGSIADPEAVAAAMDGVTHVLHLAAVKESPRLAIDVSVKGMFVLLEAFRTNPVARRFVLLGGDCSVGHIFQAYDAPITETAPRRAYPGCYALTKVIEEVMLEQYGYQYGIDGCILRAPWIMEKDDLRYAMSFGEDQFGGPNWADLMTPDTLAAARTGQHVPLLRDVTGAPLRRNFIHVDDVVEALLTALDHPYAARQAFNIAMAEPVDYGRLAVLLNERTGAQPIDIETPFHSNWLDCTKAAHLLGWRPRVDLETLVDRAWAYRRAAGEARTTWYPG
ncbi:NAD-dependent epimerase/dehydratase family protein [Roseinatronobacter alkalisoli]|uniref:NAD(P)-dependent oxidoreductase n=1 Tax=Roseinatronobacter alkalisoli TaxID=3028235 RepID=A0ABT5TCK9_9RHOB|nr:NAD(P)-dependent oxidoreductase [Roseinatronobacter sp. HJB301]MDD7972834.1 NAD(P)-dependent oxidoreductase [Roseinatronobacter sp. HJB301]